MNKEIHIALDFDKTLAYHESSWGISKVGDAIQPMLNYLREWLSKGYKVSIFTARVNELDHTEEEVRKQVDFIAGFLARYDLPPLPITAVKRNYFSHFVDDKAYHVDINTGIISDKIDI